MGHGDSGGVELLAQNVKKKKERNNKKCSLIVLTPCVFPTPLLVCGISICRVVLHFLWQADIPDVNLCKCLRGSPVAGKTRMWDAPHLLPTILLLLAFTGQTPGNPERTKQLTCPCASQA